jgi:excinuclease ABC subunit A
VVEHHLDVIKCADWVIDLGPGGGESGGQIVAEGHPEKIANSPESITGKYLSCLLTETSLISTRRNYHEGF